MSPRTGRPTDNPKTLNTRIRLSEKDKKRLEFCCAVLNITQAEIIRQGIEQMYEKALTIKSETPVL
jgi:predicted DNA-binding protein